MWTNGLAQGLVQGVYGAVALGGGDDALAPHGELDRCLRGRKAVGALLAYDPERLELEERAVLAGGATDQKRQRRVGGLVVVALVLPPLYGREDLAGVPRVYPELLGFCLYGVLAGELPDRRPPDVADDLWGDVLVSGRVLAYAVHVQPALVGERAPADVGPVRVGREVHQLGDVV